jgi:hypothetical protein
MYSEDVYVVASGVRSVVRSAEVLLNTCEFS